MGQKESPETYPKIYWNLMLIEVASYMKEVKMNILINDVGTTGKQAGDQ